MRWHQRTKDSDSCFDNLGASRDLGEDVCSALSMVRCSAEPASRGLSFLQSHRLLHPHCTVDGPSVIFGCERRCIGMTSIVCPVSIPAFRLSLGSVCFAAAQGCVQENHLPPSSFSQMSVGPGGYRSPRVPPQDFDGVEISRTPYRVPQPRSKAHPQLCKYVILRSLIGDLDVCRCYKPPDSDIVKVT